MNERDPRPRLALTMGDPSGIGPEVVLAAWRSGALHECCRAVAIGSPAVFQRAAEVVPDAPRIVPVHSIDEADASTDRVPCLEIGTADAASVAWGEVNALGGRAAYDAVVLATRLALAGDADGIVTAPLNKKALAAAGVAFPGHTELLAHLCGVPSAAMMLYLPPGGYVQGPGGLGVVHVTLHMALRDVPSNLSIDKIEEAIERAAQVMSRLLPAGAPLRIGVAALNPHAGEDGLFGDEESRLIRPAVERACERGFPVEGPLPADTLLLRAAGGAYDGVVAMYHDQGHIALKLLGMHEAVNVTLGLPIVRTSVAHGTAFDLAGSGAARHEGVLAAATVAARLVESRKTTP